MKESIIIEMPVLPIEPEEMPNEHTRIMNVTGHLVKIGTKEYDSVGQVRLIAEAHKVGEAAGVPVTKVNYTSGMLPQREYNTIYIVAVIVCRVNPTRDDFYIPSTKDKMGKFLSISQNPYYVNTKETALNE